MPQQYRIVRVHSAARLREVAEFNIVVACTPDVPLHVLAQWWTLYPDGIRVAETPDGRIIGMIGVWPVRPRVYDALRGGRYTPSQLRSHDFARGGERHSCWYMSGFGVAPELSRSGRFIGNFITMALEDVRRRSGVLDPMICTISSDNVTARRLKRFAFEQTNDGRYGSVYELLLPLES